MLIKGVTCQTPLSRYLLTSTPTALHLHQKNNRHTRRTTVHERTRVRAL